MNDAHPKTNSYLISLDEFDLKFVKNIAKEMEHDLYSLPIEEATIQGILNQIINQANTNEQI